MTRPKKVRLVSPLQVLGAALAFIFATAVLFVLPLVVPTLIYALSVSLL